MREAECALPLTCAATVGTAPSNEDPCYSHVFSANFSSGVAYQEVAAPASTPENFTELVPPPRRSEGAEPNRHVPEFAIKVFVFLLRQLFNELLASTSSCLVMSLHS
jgi:hypothetical protein